MSAKQAWPLRPYVLGVLAAACVVAAAMSYNREGATEMLSAAELPALDAQIHRDEKLLKMQEAIVQRGEARLGGGRTVRRHQVHRLQQRVARGRVPSQLAGGEGGEGGEAVRNGRTPSSMDGKGFAWEKRMINRHLGEMEREHRGKLYGNVVREDGEYNQKMADDWGKFFDELNTEVDVPKYGVKNLLIDNIEAIPPCNMDCDETGSVKPDAFEWYDDLNTKNKRGKIVDNIKDITACLIDC